MMKESQHSFKRSEKGRVGVGNSFQTHKLFHKQKPEKNSQVKSIIKGGYQLHLEVWAKFVAVPPKAGTNQEFNP